MSTVAATAPNGSIDGGRPAPCPAAAYLRPFHEMAAMIGLMKSLPDCADDVADWRPRSAAGGASARRDEMLRLFDGFDPLMRRAFEAVAAGLDELASAAVALCVSAARPLAPHELEACARIGGAMRRLLERATALVESVRSRRGALTPASAGLPAPPGRCGGRIRELTFFRQQELTFL
jgi:hypothetical protein